MTEKRGDDIIHSMSAETKPKKHRHKRGYTLLIVPDDSDDLMTSIRCGHTAAQMLAFFLFFAAVILICYIVYTVVTIDGMQRVEMLQLEQIADLEKEKEELSLQNGELSSKVDQLSKSISQKAVKEAIAEEEDAEKHLPTGFPVNGAANMIGTRDIAEIETIEDSMKYVNDRLTEGMAVEDLPGEPVMHLTDVAEGSGIVATGDGTVAQIEEDKKYGKRIVIDHGNGYQSIYRNSGDPLVRVGDDVSRGSILIVIRNNKTVGYQIVENGTYIDPETMATIDG